MATKLKRTSMALDEATVEALEYLSDIWHTSKAEVIRRVVKEEQEKQQKSPSMSLEERLTLIEQLGTKPLLSPDQAKAALEEIRHNRENTRDPWAGHHAH